jgi:hypothetical protein
MAVTNELLELRMWNLVWNWTIKRTSTLYTNYYISSYNLSYSVWDFEVIYTYGLYLNNNYYYRATNLCSGSKGGACLVLYTTFMFRMCWYCGKGYILLY